MAIFLLGIASTGDGTVSSTAQSAFFSPGTAFEAGNAPTENQNKTQWQDAGTFKNFYANVITNTFGVATTITFRNAGVNGNESISVTNNTTGFFADLVDTDTISSGAQINYAQVTTGTGNFLCASMTQAFLNSGGKGGSMFNTSEFATTPAVPGNSINYLHPAGKLQEWDGAENSGPATRVKACTISNLYISLVGTNTLTNTTTFRSRVALANGNCSLSFASGATGIFRDTTDNDVIADNTLLDWQADASSSGGGNAPTAVAGAWMEYGSTILQNFSAGDETSINTGTGTVFLTFMGGLGTTTTELNAQIKVTGSYLWRNLRVITLSNPTANISYVSRKNGANGLQAVSIPNGTNGTFEDTADIDVISLGDVINAAFVMGASATIGYRLTTNQLGQLPDEGPKPKPRPKPKPKAPPYFPYFLWYNFRYGQANIIRKVVTQSSPGSPDLKRLLYMGVR